MRMIRKIKRLWRIWIYLTQWMPHGWNPSDMTRSFWEGPGRILGRGRAQNNRETQSKKQ